MRRFPALTAESRWCRDGLHSTRLTPLGQLLFWVIAAVILGIVIPWCMGYLAEFFYRMGRSDLLCDGRIPVGDVGHTRTCDKRICRACAGRPIALVTVATNRGRRGDTRDLCPDCRKLERAAI